MFQGNLNVKLKGNTYTENIRLRGEDIPAKVGEVRHQDLLFYPENPRIYSIVYSGGGTPTQEEIYRKLRDKDHVKHLVQSIKSNDGLHEPVIVRQGVVLEGNSRLAAYRILAESDPIKWSYIKVKILPEDTSDKLVFALLGEYHLVGKKDWQPYEQAGYLYRQYHEHGVTIEEIARNAGLRKAEVNHLVTVYRFMLDSGQNDVAKWSYYDEYIKSRFIRAARKKFPELDQVVIGKINSGEIYRAADVRDKLKIIAQDKNKNLKKFVEGERDFDHAHEIASRQGHVDAYYKRINQFRNFISDTETEKDLLALDKAVLDKCHYEINKIHIKLGSLLKKIEKKKT